MSQDNDWLKKLKDIFDECDIDKDGKLREDDFNEFARRALNKNCPSTMYAALCQHYQISPNSGLEWEHTKDLFRQANASRVDNGTDLEQSGLSSHLQSNSHPSLKDRTSLKDVTNGDLATTSSMSSSNKSSSNNGSNGETTEGVKYFRRGDKIIKNEPVPNGDIKNNSTGVNLMIKENESIGSGDGMLLTEKTLRNHESQNSLSTDSHSQLEDMTEHDTNDDSVRKSLYAARLSRARNSSTTDSADSSELQIMGMMEKKINSTKKELEKERQRRIQSESLLQQLLQQNDQFKFQISDLQNQLKNLQQEHEKEKERNDQQKEGLQNRLSKLQSQMDTERTKLIQMESQNATLKEEKEEAIGLLRKIEKEYDSKLQKLITKHGEELQQVSNSYLQVLGVEPGQDVKTVLKQLKDKNESLRQQVDLLAETLIRKEHSLLEALRAVDEMSGKVASSTQNGTEEHKENESNHIKLATPPNPTEDQTSRAVSRSYTNLNASFFKKVSTASWRQPHTHSGVSHSEPKCKSQPRKESQSQTQSLSNSLTNNAPKNQEAIVNLEVANSVLRNQVMELQQQLEDMQQSKRSKTPSAQPRNK